MLNHEPPAPLHLPRPQALHDLREAEAGEEECPKVTKQEFEKLVDELIGSANGDGNYQEELSKETRALRAQVLGAFPDEPQSRLPFSRKCDTCGKMIALAQPVGSAVFYCSPECGD